MQIGDIHFKLSHLILGILGGTLGFFVLGPVGAVGGFIIGEVAGLLLSGAITVGKWTGIVVAAVILGVVIYLKSL
ncbi:MAG: hypothetical protein K0S74_877 [Chlamydiales bacterium]|nr:hypothetical protein [Chlamydiales bacterium]